MMVAVHKNADVIFRYMRSIYKFLNLYTIVNLLRVVYTCSPPNTLKGDNSIRRSSLLHRADQAKIILVGSVVELNENDIRRSVMAKIAVHVKLKGDNVSRIINVSGFNTHRHKKLFRSESLLDCTGTTVELYGTYLFFLKLNRHKTAYHVDEIQMQPAVVQIPCNRQHKTSRDVVKMLKKYRKLRRTNKVSDVQCFTRTRTRTKQRRCLRKRIFWRVIYKFTFNNIRTRTVYCSLRNSSSHNNNNNVKRTRKTHIKLHDYIPKSNIKSNINVESNVRTAKRTDRTYIKEYRTPSSANNRQLHDYIVQSNVRSMDRSFSRSTSSINNNNNNNNNIPKSNVRTTTRGLFRTSSTTSNNQKLYLNRKKRYVIIGKKLRDSVVPVSTRGDNKRTF